MADQFTFESGVPDDFDDDDDDLDVSELVCLDCGLYHRGECW